MWIELTHTCDKQKFQINIAHVVTREKHRDGGTLLLTILDVHPDSCGFHVIETPEEINQIIKEKIDLITRKRSARAARNKIDTILHGR